MPKASEQVGGIMSHILGLTGGIATGKSTASKFFKQEGFPVVDADYGARMVVEPGEPGLEAIKAHFGADIVFPNGVLDRKKLGAIIFENPSQREQLNGLLRQPIRDWLNKEKEKYIAEGHELIIMDVPLLFESKSEDQCDDIMVIYVSETMQLDRLMARDGLNSVDAFKRMTSQMSIERKANMADFVIDNSGTIEETYQQLAAWLGIFGYQPLK